MKRRTSQRGLLVIGEALVDVMYRDGEPTQVLPGGSPLNVAVGLGRLGLPTRLRTRFGMDPYGELIAAHLAANDVEVVAGAASGAATSIAEARIGPAGVATYTFQVQWELDDLVAQSRDIAAVHTGSLAALLDPGASVVRAELDRLRDVATVSYDPNIRPQLLGEREATGARVMDMVAGADIVKASDEDAAWLFPDAPDVRVAREWLMHGPSIVVMTQGAAGAHAVTRAGEVHVEAQPTRVADTVGAGDSFMAGLLAALAGRGLLGRDRAPLLRAIDLNTTREVMEFAAACAAITVARRGADLPYWRELAASDAGHSKP